ncbi:hypothetical protein NA57DRAFT_64137 [Rhizodiscina lignyota]|uniref:Uncharacterized protein n=1 Tax=Rhizodiscina lignyota TaxID=1504668 RepID=A0A9P4IKD1_9PEZI|nr:hypothetical protein NA57DRAFT_64137 [Rhizodiscina lignyota]
MDEQAQQQPALTQVARPLSLIPVTIKEAALDSPTFRATALHFSEQIELIERWLDNYVKAASKLCSEASTLENLVNAFLTSAAPPPSVSEAVLDHDYTLLALRRYGDGSREWWNQTLRGVKRLESAVCEPVRQFLQNDMRSLKEARRNLENAQRTFDGLIGRYASQSKTKEASSLREDAFQLHESRKLYLKASMDFCVLAPQVRATLDQLLVRIISEQWKDMKSSRENTTASFAKWTGEMDRIRGWSKEMEAGERVFKRELHMARKQIEDSAEHGVRPSRELDDYALSTVPYLGTAPPTTSKQNTHEKAEKQSWLFQRTISGKPARTIWVRRWFFVKNGIFGWLVQGARSGAVEESEKIGVLLCGVRPAFQEERRFCFEVKTKDSTIMLQAETQNELTEWISAFEVAKRKALEDPASTDLSAGGNSSVIDPAFAISPPIAPELAARTGEGHASQGSEDISVERTGTLPVPDRDGTGGLATRASFDVTQRRPFEAPESSRDQYARIIQKLDLHRKSTATPQLSSSAQGSPAPGGIASLITASHAIMPVGPGAVQSPAVAETKNPINFNALAVSTLAPSTLAYPPAPTNLSKTAVVISGERGLSAGKQDGGMPGGLLANLWGTNNWGWLARLERGETRSEIVGQNPSPSKPPTPGLKPELTIPEGTTADSGSLNDENRSHSPSPSPKPRSRSPSLPSGPSHRKTASAFAETPKLPTIVTAVEDYPNYYPIQLKAQDAQFRLLFPYVPRGDTLVLVFRATWNPNDQQEFPGRVYVTLNNIFFYSHHLGLVLITSIALSSITEVTAAPGRDCDFLFLHFKEGVRQDGASRVTIKTFLEPLKLLQRRLNYLVRNCNAETETPQSLEEIIKALIRMEVDDAAASPSIDSWEDVDIATPIDGMPASRRDQDVKASLRIDGTLYRDEAGAAAVSKNATKFKLPAQPVLYTPQGMAAPALERELNISAKSLFHVLCGDKSAVFQILYCTLCASKLIQTPWKQPSATGHYRREFQYQVSKSGQSVTDHQVIDVYNDHLCYVITHRGVPWYLPSVASFNLLTKIVITHVSKARCKLAVFTKVEWVARPLMGQRLINARAQRDLNLIALSLADLLEDQAGRVKSSSVTSNSSTRKALAVFGHVGVATSAQQLSASDVPPSSRLQRLRLQRTSLAALGFEVGRAVLGDVISALLGAVVAGLQTIIKTVSAHGLLVALLALSAMANLFLGHREGWAWWREHSALKYMGRLGVGSGNAMVMGRAVWLRDVEAYDPIVDVLQPNRDGEGNKCVATFRALLSAGETSGSSGFSPLEPFASSVPQQTSTTLSNRLQRTRNNLATYRHDLLVAMRVVNRVEKEVVQAEYEAWVDEEARRCRRVGKMIVEREENKSKQITNDKGWDSLKSGWKEYCGDCIGAAGDLDGNGLI